MAKFPAATLAAHQPNEDRNGGWGLQDFELRQRERYVAIPRFMG